MPLSNEEDQNYRRLWNGAAFAAADGIFAGGRSRLLCDHDFLEGIRDAKLFERRIAADNKPPHGRINTTERETDERKRDFLCIECGMTDEEAYAEASRCLRCDHFGYGIFRRGRKGKW